MKKKFKLTIGFDGSQYHGWQKQTNTPDTIQGILEKTLSEIFKEKVLTQGSGRTDARVHSLCHVVVFEAPFEIEESGLCKGINSLLPKNIRCLSAEAIDYDLVPTSDAKSRRYQYLFSVGGIASPFQEKYMAHISYPLDFEKMNEACKVFIGRHDFERFMTQGSEPNSTIREVFDSQIIESSENFHGLFPDHFVFVIEANGFLKQMVRLIFGSIVEVGRGRLTVQEIEYALSHPAGEHIAPCAPPEGLYKVFAKY